MRSRVSTLGCANKEKVLAWIDVWRERLMCS